MSEHNEEVGGAVATSAAVDCGSEVTRSVGVETVGVRRDERGMVSAEWAVGIIAAIAIAGVLLAVVTSGPVEDLLLQVILKIIGAFTRGL